MSRYSIPAPASPTGAAPPPSIGHGPRRPWTLRRLIGLLINVGGGLALIYFMLDTIQRDARVAEAVVASALAGLATGVGALALPLVARHGLRRIGQMMAFGAGLMFAAALVSLLWPALKMAGQPLAVDALAGMALGLLAMWLLDWLLPHLHAAPQDASSPLPVNALCLMGVAIAVHNLPEGFAVGAGFSGGPALGWATALSIGLQNIPEGLIVASALWSLRLPRWVAITGALATGLMEPLGAVLGGAMTIFSEAAVAPALGFAGGGMMYIVLHELLPESLRLLGTRQAVYRIFGASTLLVALLLAAIG